MIMDVYSSTALKIYPPFQVYNSDTRFTSLLCVNNDGSPVSDVDNIEWLDSNLTLMTSTPDYRIDGIKVYS